VEATLDTTYLLPGLLRDLVASSRAQLQQATIAAQQRLIQKLSTPIIPISEAILVLPLILSLDRVRGKVA
jgi:hypothetical protein